MREIRQSGSEGGVAQSNALLLPLSLEVSLVNLLDQPCPCGAALEEDTTKAAAIEPLVQKVKKSLGDLVKDVRASSRLADSPSCIVVDEHDPTVQMQQILKMMGNKDLPEVKPILEINPTHPIVVKLAAVQDQSVIKDTRRLLLEQALLVEGGELKDPAGFVKRLNRALEKAL